MQLAGRDHLDPFQGSQRFNLEAQLPVIAPLAIQWAVGTAAASAAHGVALIPQLVELARRSENPAPVTRKDLRDYSRVLFASAFDEVPDKQGRITVPPALRTYADLERDCVVIGANTRMEIWDATAWETYLASQEEAFSEASQEVLPGIL